jgi:hypothetical protein
MKTLIAFLFLAAATVHAQTSPAQAQGGTPAIPKDGTSRSDFAAQSVFDRIAKEVAKRSGHPEDLDSIGRASLRITFLMDSSQNTAKDFLPVFEKKLVSGILRRIGNAQLKASVSQDQLDLVSVYPYQLHLIQDPKWSLSDRVLKKGEGTVEAVIDHIPPQRVQVAGEGELGHDSSGARAALIKLLGPNANSGDRQNLIIQMTPTAVNSDPKDPENNKKLVEEDARAGLLDGTDFSVFDDDGRFYQTDAPGQGVSASDVHVWVYGPQNFKLVAAGTGSPAPQAGPVGQNANAPDSAGPPVPLIIVGVLVLAAIGYVIYRFTLKVPVEMDGEIAKAGFSRPIAVIVAGGKIGENTLQISPQRKGNVGEGLKVGEITMPLLFGGPKISGAGGHTMYVLNSSTPELSLGQRVTNISFGKGEARTATIPFKLK